jgi:ABC-type branched-subunit amino acid transport system substrate-binding protein
MWMADTEQSRRVFLCTVAYMGAALLPGMRARAMHPRAQESLRVGLAAPPAGDAAASAVRGVTMGVEEASRTGALLGRAMELVPVDGDADTLVGMARAEGIAAVVGGWDDGSAAALGAAADAAGILFVNAGARGDALRGAGCARGAFHVQASERMYAAALAARPDDAADATEAALWHPSLERFGAGQLNERFRARFGGAGMDGAAWAGWMAAKVLWEASLRARSTEPAALRAHLLAPSTQLDGHKGWPLSFRPWDGQLRQPLYLLAEGGARVAGEVPARAAEGGPTSRELLDRLGGDASTSTCVRTGEGTT